MYVGFGQKCEKGRDYDIYDDDNGEAIPECSKVESFDTNFHPRLILLAPRLKGLGICIFFEGQSSERVEPPIDLPAIKEIYHKLR